jgi:hypothetical protein
MGVADGLKASQYLLQLYVESSLALEAFEKTGNVEALNKAASLICEALQRLAEDKSFWAELAKLNGPVTENQRSIKEAFDELDEFLTQEGKVLRQHKFPESVFHRLLFDLSASIKSFQGKPDAELLARLPEAVREAAQLICAVSKVSKADAEEGKALGIALKIREGLGILGGAVTIVVDGITSTTVPIALWSIVGGAASVFGFLAWFKRKKKD